MPLLGNGEYKEPILPGAALPDSNPPNRQKIPPRKQSQHSLTARMAMNQNGTPITNGTNSSERGSIASKDASHPSSNARGEDGNSAAPLNVSKAIPSNGAALSDTPVSTASNSPTM